MTLNPMARLMTVANPIAVEIEIVIAGLVNGEQHREIYQLKNNVSEEDRELAMQFAPKHRRGQQEFQGRVGKP